ncbi:MAG: hypothetical protein Q7L19_04235 [Pseudohongiella sp.]|nr:hypothetical protein [Pseudohongiella sp.]
MKSSLFLVIAVVTTFVSASLHSFGASAEVTLNDGIYTAEQAASGKPLFEQNCSTCHNVDFYKNTLNTYNGQPVLYFYEAIMAGMPADNPGVLMENEYEDILAHIFMLLGFPPGDQRLTYTSDRMLHTKVVPSP